MNPSDWLVGLSLVSNIIRGQATYYSSDSIFTEVWRNRQAVVQPCNGCVGFAALLDCNDLGTRVWVSNGIEWVGPLLVIDCADKRHRDMLLRRGWVVDLLADRWGMQGPIEVEVRKDGIEK